MDNHRQRRAARRPNSYSASDSSGARRGIRTPDRLIKRISLYGTSRFAPDLRSGSPFDSTRTALQHHMTTVAKFGESPKQVRATDCSRLGQSTCQSVNHRAMLSLASGPRFRQQVSLGSRQRRLPTRVLTDPSVALLSSNLACPGAAPFAHLAVAGESRIVRLLRRRRPSVSVCLCAPKIGAQIQPGEVKGTMIGGCPPQ